MYINTKVHNRKSHSENSFLTILHALDKMKKDNPKLNEAFKTVSDEKKLNPPKIHIYLRIHLYIHTYIYIYNWEVRESRNGYCIFAGKKLEYNKTIIYIYIQFLT